VGEVFGRLAERGASGGPCSGFVGAPWTLAAYAVEGKSSRDYAVIKAMAFQEPACFAPVAGGPIWPMRSPSLCALTKIRTAAPEVVQLFDSWAGQLSPLDYDVFAAPYQQTGGGSGEGHPPRHPSLILYISGSCRVLERHG